MQLKIPVTRLTYKVANKWLNVREWAEVAESNKDGCFPSTAVCWIVSVCALLSLELSVSVEEMPDIKKSFPIKK